MDERVRVDSSMSVDVGTVKQVLHQVLGQARQPEASPSVQAVLPRSLLDGPLPDAVAPLVASLRAKISRRARGGAGIRSVASASSSRWASLDPDAVAAQVREELHKE